MKMWKEDLCCWPEYTSIYESECRILAGISALWGKQRMESGGAIFGLWTHGARPVILFVTGPGQAIHEPAYFEQEVDFVHRMNSIIAGKYGIQLIGFYHCHQFLGIQGPSSGDMSQVQSITSKNNFTRWCERMAKSSQNEQRTIVCQAKLVQASWTIQPGQKVRLKTVSVKVSVASGKPLSKYLWYSLVELLLSCKPLFWPKNAF